MGSFLRLCCAASVRALLVPALLALAWLVWGAGSAQASADPTEGAGSETATAPVRSLLGVPSVQVTQVLPVRQDPASSAAPAVATAADAAGGEAAAAVSTVSETAVPAVSTVTETAAPVLSEVDRAAASVGDAVASMGAGLPRLPVPVVKLPSVPRLDVQVLTVPKTVPPGAQHTPRAVPPAVSAAASSAPAAGRPVAEKPSPAVPQSRAAKASAAAKSSSPAAPSASARTVSPVAEVSSLGSVQKVDSPFKTLAQLRMTASARPVATAVQAPFEGHLNNHFTVEPPNLAATHVKSGSSGSDSSGAQAADMAAGWSGPASAAGDLAYGAAVTPPSSPAYDPGSSPD
jgi:hypothetical protein